MCTVLIKVVYLNCIAGRSAYRYLGRWISSGSNPSTQWRERNRAGPGSKSNKNDSPECPSHCHIINGSRQLVRCPRYARRETWRRDLQLPRQASWGRGGAGGCVAAAECRLSPGVTGTAPRELNRKTACDRRGGAALARWLTDQAGCPRAVRTDSEPRKGTPMAA